MEDRLREINSLSYQPKARVVFGDFAEDWRHTVLPQHKVSTQCTELSHLENFILPFFKNHNLSDVTPGEIQRFIAGIRRAPKYVRNVFSTLQIMWNTAKIWGHVEDKLEAKDFQFPRAVPKERPAFTPEQMRMIIQAAEEPWRTFFWLAAETGMRVGELCGLRKEDVSEGFLQVRQSAWRGIVGTPKSLHGTRRIDLSPELSTQLQNVRRGNDVQYLFATAGGRVWSAGNVHRKLNAMLTKLGYGPAGMHAFRHGNASLLIGTGEDPSLVAQRLGHRDASITLRVYAHALPHKGRELADRMSSVLFVPTIPTQVVDSVPNSCV